MRFLGCQSVVIACGFMFLVGCGGPATNIISNKDAEYSAAPKRIFMVSAVGTDFGGKFRQLFESKMTQIMNSCGVNVQIAYRGEVRLNDDYEERAKTFQADTIMVINRSRGTIQSMEQIKSTYDVRLQEAASNKLVWRANVDFDIRNQSGGLEERAGSLVTALFNKMKSDGLLTNCSAD